MDCEPFLVDLMFNKTTFAEALIDSGCLCYAAIDQKLCNQLKLPRIPIAPRHLQQAAAISKESIRWITYADVDIAGHRRKLYFYVVSNLSHPVILGLPWMDDEDVTFSARKRRLHIGTSGIRVWSKLHQPSTKGTQEIQAAKMISGSTFLGYMQRASKEARRETAGNQQKTRQELGYRIFSASLADIEKTLKKLDTKKRTVDIKAKLPKELHHHLNLFSELAASVLPRHRPDTDHKIELLKDKSGKEMELPWGPLYNMSRDELLVLRKVLTDYLDKGFIRASSSPAAAPVLFARKPGGGLRFCVDYRALNARTKPDRYPLPLIHETLRMLSKAKWFTKIDVVAAFHKIRIAEGDEWKTAFRTRYGLYEWLVLPFGLTGGPATFQRYINRTLQDILDIYCSAYIDDILVFSDGTLEDHYQKVSEVLSRLQRAGLPVDIDKCEFGVQEVKYLGFVIQAGKGVHVDPEKVRAISEWEAPTTVKGVRQFLGFANFYREFISDFSTLARPLISLTKKAATFQWGHGEDSAFEKLKQTFITAPVLAQWDPDRLTVVEADSSGYATGACLSQYDEEGRLRPVAYASQRLSPSECNYEIHDKELLAIMRALKQWDGELRSVAQPFTILSDHNNLRFFLTARSLNERQVRWVETLSRYNFQIQFRPGKKANRPDALSRREQDMPHSEADARLQGRIMQIFKPHQIADPSQKAVQVAPTETLLLDNDPTWNPISEDDPRPQSVQLFPDPDWQRLWDEAWANDRELADIWRRVYKKERSFPPALKIKVSIAECHIDSRGLLLFRDRIWVPAAEPLRTRLIQDTHDSHITGHPGRDSTFAILSRRFFWPGLSKGVRRFVRNCDVCGRVTIWRHRKKGLLKPLPIPDRNWQDISIDFMDKLPATGPQGATNLMVITDRLSKMVVLVSTASMEAHSCADAFFHHWVAHHAVPRSIISDRGTNWVGAFWRRVCELTGMEQRLSTAYHPETDGSTERANQEVQAYIRIFIAYAQDDWGDLLPAAMLAINNRDAGAAQLSPFFITHGYHADPIQVHEITDPAPANSQRGRGEAFVRKLQETTEFVQAAIAAGQQRMQDTANRHRDPAERFAIGDKVWLSLRDFKTQRPSRKFDWLHAKYSVTRVISPHVVELDVPGRKYNRFHVDLLRRAATDPLPSQQQDDSQPAPFVVEDEDGAEGLEYEVENISAAKGRRPHRKVLVKWKGYARPTWEPLDNFKETVALDDFEARYGDAEINDGPGDPRASTQRHRRVQFDFGEEGEEGR
jgi:transposase InsO family protein